MASCHLRACALVSTHDLCAAERSFQRISIPVRTLTLARGSTYLHGATSWPRSLNLASHRSARTRPRRPVHVRADGSTPQNTDIQLYGKIERVFKDSAQWSQGGSAGNWEEVEGAWVLRPSQDTAPRAVVHFIGGAFVGASPQLTYRLFLKELADRGVLIIATPYACGFDHFRIADETQFRFDRCVRTLTAPDTDEASLIRELPVFGLGHSMGALAHLLIGSRYAVQRAGNVLVSFNNKEASRAIPLFSPVVMPMTQNLGPLLTQILKNPTLRMGADLALKQLKDVNSPFLAQILPLFEQLPPLYNDLANGRDEFVPTPDETRNLVRSYYGVRRNMLVKFKDDAIDETPSLADTLSVNSSVSNHLDLSIRTLPGDHARPLQQEVPDIPEAVSQAVNQGSQLFAAVPGMAPFADLARDFLTSSLAQGFAPTVGSGFESAQRLREQTITDIRDLVDEIAPFMGGDVSTQRSERLLLP